ncbi:MAG: hypothetical protein H6907_03575 [Hyphomicrobiales bacterium]|nr:hypothetical protein [Hyphomicrobiales bacterium]MCP5370789.1 hypothetical protein [Hyphomicrobiales bacterium]
MAQATGNGGARKPGVAAGPKAGPAGGALAHDRYQIDPDKPLPHLSTPSAEAYEVQDAANPGRRLFALVCAHGLPLRTDVLAALQGQQAPGMLPLVDWVRVDWPPLNRVCVAVIYEVPLGGRVKDEIPESLRPAARVDLLKRVVDATVDAFTALDDMGITHRAIRPENIFFLDEGQEVVVLGDCVTAPAGYDQPLAYETIECGMADPAGRGAGDLTADVYALGAVLADLLLRSRDHRWPDDADLLRAKANRGSFAALVGDAERLPATMRTLVQGLLQDEIRDRWNLDDVVAWREGRKSSTAGQRVRRRADARLTLAGREHGDVRALAHAMGRHVPEAAQMLRSGEVDGWLLRGIKLPEMAVAMKDLVAASRDHGETVADADDYLVARASMVLDPLAPIRFKGFSFMVDGFGPALAHAMVVRGETQVPAEVLVRNLPKAWLAARPHRAAEWEEHFNNLRGMVQNQNPGYGIERCLYEANPGFPCQAPLIARDYVVRLDELLPALDRAVKRGDVGSRPYDRHLAAFVAARIDERVDSHLLAAADPRDEVSSLGILSVLAVLQWRLQTPPTYALAKAMGDLVQPAVEAYHSRTIRKEIGKEKANIVRRGNLVELYNLIENAKRRKKDADGFAAAQDAFAAAEDEIRSLSATNPERARAMAESGRQMASVSSILLTLIVVSILLIVEVT